MDMKWDLSRIYQNEDAFLKDLEFFKNDITPKMAALEGKLGEEKDFVSFFLLEKQADEIINKLYMFASHRSDLNRKDVKNAEDESKVELAVQDFSSRISFEEPEILALGEARVKEILKKNPEVQEFDFELSKLFRREKHVLEKKSEELLSKYSPLEGVGSNLYSNLTVADYSPKQATLSDGSLITVSQSSWTRQIAEAKTAEDRKTIFETLYSYYDTHKNAYGAIYDSVLQAELAIKKTRGFDSILEEHLFNNNIPVSIFHNLVEAANKGSAPLKKYYELRRKYLGLEKHRSYDRFIELAKSEKKYSYEEAKDLFFDSIKAFPSDFQSKAHEVLKDGYVDVYPSEGKRTGAYSSGGANIHPYILFNFEGTLDDCFTLAHESGHSIHTLYSMEAQPITKQNYTIFVAEIASTFNEHNLLDYLMGSNDLSKNDKIFLLQKAIDEICSTFYRQTLFGQFELEASQIAERGEPINYEVLSKIMIHLYSDYFGIDITEENVKPLVWAYIPHLFYTPFYVYQYATSFTASMLIYKNVKEGKKGAFNDYLNLLRSGGSEFPIDEVKKAHVDLTDPASFKAVIERMEELVNTLESLLKE